MKKVVILGENSYIGDNFYNHRKNDCEIAYNITDFETSIKMCLEQPNGK